MFWANHRQFRDIYQRFKSGYPPIHPLRWAILTPDPQSAQLGIDFHGMVII